MSGIVRDRDQSYRAPGVVRKAFNADTLQLDVNDQVLLADMTSGAGTVTLPPVSEAAGRIYTVRVVAGTNTLTVAAYGDSIALAPISQGTKNLTDDREAYYSDGFAWYLVASHIG